MCGLHEIYVYIPEEPSVLQGDVFFLETAYLVEDVMAE
jgi:hypothetical protein